MEATQKEELAEIPPNGRGMGIGVRVVGPNPPLQFEQGTISRYPMFFCLLPLFRQKFAGCASHVTAEI